MVYRHQVSLSYSRRGFRHRVPKWSDLLSFFFTDSNNHNIELYLAIIYFEIFMLMLAFYYLRAFSPYPDSPKSNFRLPTYPSHVILLRVYTFYTHLAVLLC